MTTDKKVILFDVDGTLADCTHRQHHVQQGKKRWDLFNKTMHEDKPHGDIIFLAQLFYAQGHTVIICSGRGTEFQDVTTKWLNDHGVQFHDIYMRPIKDSRRDDIIKAELLEHIRADHGEPFMVFDDRQQVVDMWRREGVRCLQVQPGDF